MKWRQSRLTPQWVQASKEFTESELGTSFVRQKLKCSLKICIMTPLGVITIWQNMNQKVPYCISYLTNWSKDSLNLSSSDQSWHQQLALSVGNESRVLAHETMFEYFHQRIYSTGCTVLVTLTTQAIDEIKTGLDYVTVTSHDRINANEKWTYNRVGHHVHSIAFPQ